VEEIKNIILKSNILLVDDNIDNLDILERMLAGAGYKVTPVSSGEMALKECDKKAPDLILLDIDMPQMNGYEVCTYIKSNPALKDIPVIFLSGLSDAKQAVEAFKIGGVDYITKPVHVEELRSRVKTHLEIKHSRQTIASYADQLQNTINDMSALFETGTLVASVVHDAKKFTSAISMLLEAMIIPKLKEKLDESEPWVEDLLFDISEVKTSSDQCSEYLESLLSINRKNEEVEPVDILKIINQAMNLVSYNLIQDGIQWEIKYDKENELRVLGNNQLVRVFMNLIVNATDVLKKRETLDPKITIEIENGKKAIKISVIDNGPGINKEVLEGIRKGMILSTKGKDGNGFGVSGLTKIVKSLNATIDIESDLGKGAAFIITLQKSI
jgi:DNA-binding response OmpR family regulator